VVTQELLLYTDGASHLQQYTGKVDHCMVTEWVLLRCALEDGTRESSSKKNLIFFQIERRAISSSSKERLLFFQIRAISSLKKKRYLFSFRQSASSHVRFYEPGPCRNIVYSTTWMDNSVTETENDTFNNVSIIK
jgi:hypothetical protein